jgi:hypothetical protein
LLSIHGIDYGVSKAEIAFDTLDAEVGKEFSTSVFLKWGRPQNLFTDCKEEIQKWGGDRWNGRVYVQTKIPSPNT